MFIATPVKVLRRPLESAQFTSVDFTGVLLKHGVAISMDGRGAWRDNVFVERLWRSVKYEEVYLRAYDSVSEARSSIGRYLAFYNHRRPHSSLDRRTPDEAYFTPSPRGGGMNFPPRAGRVYGRATTPSLHHAPARNCKGPTPAAIDLAFAESCSDDRDQLLA